MLVNVFSLNYTYGALNFFFSGLHIYSSYRKWNLRAFSPAGMSQHHISEKQKNIEFPSNIALVRKKKMLFSTATSLIYVFHDQLEEFSFFLLSAYNLSQTRNQWADDSNHAAVPSSGNRTGTAAFAYIGFSQ